MKQPYTSRELRTIVQGCSTFQELDFAKREINRAFDYSMPKDMEVSFIYAVGMRQIELEKGIKK